MKELCRVEFGNPLLRQKTRLLPAEEITTPKIKALVKNMRHTLTSKKIGVAIAAPQVGEAIALVVVAVRPTKHRPKAEQYDKVFINPRITETFGRRTQMWEGCLSAGKSGLFAKVPRYKKVRASYMDEEGNQREEVFMGLPAQIVQHEVDHLNGILFVDRVKDTSTYMTLKEYRKRIKNKR